MLPPSSLSSPSAEPTAPLPRLRSAGRATGAASLPDRCARALALSRGTGGTVSLRGFRAPSPAASPSLGPLLLAARALRGRSVTGADPGPARRPRPFGDVFSLAPCVCGGWSVPALRPDCAASASASRSSCCSSCASLARLRATATALSRRISSSNSWTRCLRCNSVSFGCTR